MEEFLTTDEISKTLRVNVLTVRRWINAKKLKAVFLGKEYRIKRSDFEDFMKKRSNV